MQTLEKESLRRKILDKRLSLDRELREKLSRRIVEKVLSLPEFEEASSYLLYYPIKGEPDVTPLYQIIWERGKTLFLPRVKGKLLEVVPVRDMSELKEGSFGIPEPSDGDPVDPSEVDFALVPGIAFDREGYRLGFGKGFYDRLLRELKAFRAGVAYSFQVVDFVPRDRWDEPVDALITEKEVKRWK